jgi:ferritin-like metal-binding protein YciE
MALKDVLLDELRDMYSAENQLLKALPKLAKGVNSEELKTLFTSHLEETKGQVERLKQIFEHLEEKPTGKHCKGMEGAIAEGSEALEEDTEGASFDSGVIGAALRTEHYEIAGYTASIAMAETLGLNEVKDLLTQNLNEEQAAAEKILNASHSIFEEASDEPEEEEEDDEEEDEESEKDEEEGEEAEEDEEEDDDEDEAPKKAAKKSPAKKSPAKKTAAKKKSSSR